MPTSASGPSDYRLAPAVGARLVGALLVALAVVLVVLTVVVAVADLSIAVLVVVALVGVLAVVGTHVALRRVVVVRLGPDHYRVRLRGAGVGRAGWREVAEAATATPNGVPVVVLRLVDGRTTTIPVTVLAANREDFARDLRAHLRDGQGLRPLS